MDVDAAGISVKVGAHYPGRSVDLPGATDIERCWEGSAEVSRGHSRSSDRTEGPNVKYGVGVSNFDDQRRGGGAGASRVMAKRGYSHPEMLQLMEAGVERENMKTAWLHVKGNKGAAGVDGKTLDVLLPYLREHWSSLKEDLLAGRYQPRPVRKVEIPKPGGGMRQLGIPTVLDRLIQQALHQV
jgi:hypothetical protein